ncbi:MAG: ABC transporter permease [Cyanobacteria bacterium HKST-UBA04]|nr:ABC transporter permease [Cyanobacteria bacterium HKST-UBA04]
MINFFERLKEWTVNQVWPVAYKEFVHMINDASTLRIALLLPTFQLIFFGYAINLDVTNIATVIYNQDRRPASYELVHKLVATSYFNIKEEVFSKDDALAAIRRGKAQVAVIIPPDYATNIDFGRQATFQVLVDGSQSSIATQVMAAAVQLGGKISQDVASKRQLGASSVSRKNPVEAKPHVLYNPDLITARFTIPGLLAIVLLNVTLFLTTFSLVKEREQGTMDQLLVTPLQPSGLLVGKMVPYVGLGLFDFNLVVVAMIVIFKVPIHGSFFLMQVFALLFLISVLGTGLLISTRSQTQMGAAQTAGLVVLPSILLSGFVFSIDAMPPIMQFFSYLIPTTYFISSLRAIILRGASFFELLPATGMLLLLGFILVSAAIKSFKRKLG